MWYYESLANQWPAPPWATDSQRFATCTVITVQFLHCTIINRNPYSERFPYRTCFSRFDLALPFLRTAANQWPKEAQATDWPTIRSTTLLTADPKSVAQKSAFCRPAHCQLREPANRVQRSCHSHGDLSASEQQCIVAWCSHLLTHHRMPLKSDRTASDQILSRRS